MISLQDIDGTFENADMIFMKRYINELSKMQIVLPAKRRETAARKSFLSKEQAVWVSENIFNKLKHLLKGRLGRVYINPAMRNYALPLTESTSQGGFGVMAAGSHIPIGEAKKIRAFTYWEKVDDIDLSVIGLNEDGV